MVDSTDDIQRRLDSVTRRLHRPSFLRLLSSSQLPSQAASETSLSPKDLPASIAARLAESPLLRPADDRESIASHEHDAYRAASILNGDATAEDPVPDRERKRREQIQAAFRIAWTSFRSAMSTFQHGSHDLVLAVDFNFYGTRMVTGSADHNLKVWDRKDENWTLIESWRAHDAEIVDVKWNGPFMGDVIGSIGEDGRFKLWEEDLTEMPGSHRRFRLIANMVSETRVPYMSLDFKNIMTETYVALITRDGFLAVYEPINHDNLSEWQVITQQYITATPSRQEETGFKVRFHREKLPCWTAIQAGLDRRCLSLAVAAMTTVKILRTDKERKFYLAAELTGARNIIRDMSWANGSMRGYDVIATASKDGAIRIYELHTPQDQKTVDVSATTANPDTSVILEEVRPRPSGIGAGLAGEPYAKHNLQQDRNAGKVMHTVKMVAELNPHHGGAWRVAFSQLGMLLLPNSRPTLIVSR